MKLSRYFRSLAAGLTLCLGFGALSVNAFAVTPMMAAEESHTLALNSDGTLGTFAALTATQQGDIITAFVALFNAAPGGYMSDWSNFLSAGNTVAAMYDAMASNSAFQSLSFSYSSASTNNQFAAAFASNLFATSVTAANLATATDSIRTLLDAGASRGAAMKYMVDFLRATPTTDRSWGAAAKYLADRVTVATDYTITLGGSSTSIAALQSVIASVIPDPAPATPGTIPAGSTAAVASITTNQTTFVANSADVLSLSATIQAGSAAGTTSDIYFQASVSGYGVFYLGANLTWSAAATPIVSGFRLADINAPNFYRIAIADLPAATYTFSVIAVRSGAGPNSSTDALALASTAITISAAAPTPTPPTCTYWISPTSQTFDASGGYGTVDVRQNQTSCLVPIPPWAATSNTSWITNVYAGSLSNGQGPAYYYVQPNLSSSPRTGTITVAGNTHTVTQSAGSANPFQGQFLGSWSGTCPAFGNARVSGSFTMDIAADGSVSGSYSGSDTGDISGTVSTSGGLSAHGTGAGGISWSGTFTETGTARHGSGSWTLESDCSGTWSTQ